MGDTIDTQGFVDYLYRLKPQQCSSLPRKDILTVVQLLKDNTVAFIARYRKEATGDLSEAEVCLIAEFVPHWNALCRKRETIVTALKEGGCYNAKLKHAITSALTQRDLDDIYAPYKKSKESTACKLRRQFPVIARWAEELWSWRGKNIQGLQARLDGDINRSVPEVRDRDTLLANTGIVIAEDIAHSVETRDGMREYVMRVGELVSKPTAAAEAIKSGKQEFKTYYDFRKPLRYMKPHQVLAINRGEDKKMLSVRIDIDKTQAVRHLHSLHHRYVYNAKDTRDNWLDEFITSCLDSAYSKSIRSALVRYVRHVLSEKAHERALTLYADNLRPVLLSPPCRGCVVLGLDPGFAQGVKAAIVSPSGDVLETATLYPHPPRKDRDGAHVLLKRMVAQHQVQRVAIGNGTASRETVQFISEFLSKYDQQEKRLSYALVNESGASVYSISKVAQEELPDLNSLQRGAVSIARRLQDPMAELVKLDPKSMGVGQYQHDMKASEIESATSSVVMRCVNAVGVNINTASVSLLQYVSGLNASLAKKICAWRTEHSSSCLPFQTRADLTKVKGLGPKTWEQAVGFVRVVGGPEPLDNTDIHPESYQVTHGLLKAIGAEAKGPSSNLDCAAIAQGLIRVGLVTNINVADDSATFAPTALETWSQKLQVGVPTLKDIIQSILKPGRDVRDSFPRPQFRRDVLDISELKVGMELCGQISSVVDFGCFVDIGVHQDGLLHVSEMRRKHEGDGGISGLDDFTDWYQPGQILPSVYVAQVDVSRKRISLSLDPPTSLARRKDPDQRTSIGSAHGRSSGRKRGRSRDSRKDEQKKKKKRTQSGSRKTKKGRAVS